MQENNKIKKQQQSNFHQELHKSPKSFSSKKTLKRSHKNSHVLHKDINQKFAFNLNNQNCKESQIQSKTSNNSKQLQFQLTNALSKKSSLMSSKSSSNLHQYRNHQEKTLISNILFKKINQIQKLQKQKKGLQDQLAYMKEGAISALVQKQTKIQDLKNQYQKIQLPLIADDNQHIMQMQKYKTNLFQLRQQIQQLKQQLQSQTRVYLRQLQDKQTQIDYLRDQLFKSRQKIFQIQQNNKGMTKQLSKLEQQNSNLSIQLNSSITDLTNLHKQIQREQSLSANEESLSQSQQTQKLLRQNSNFQQFFGGQSHMNETIRIRLQNQKAKNQKQITQLRQYYESKLNQMKKNFQYQLKQYGQQIEIKNQKQNRFQDFISEDNDNQQNIQFNRARKQSIQLFEQNLYSLIKLAENDKNLRKQIADIVVNDALSYRSKLRDYDNESQFTKNHFKYFPSSELVSQRNQINKIEEQSDVNKNPETQKQLEEIKKKLQLQKSKRRQRRKQQIKQSKQKKQSQNNKNQSINKNIKKQKMYVILDQKDNKNKASWDGLMSFGIGLLTGGAVLVAGLKLLKK